MIQKIFIWTSPLPLMMFWIVNLYVRPFEGWGSWAGGILLLGPWLLSLLMGAMGLVLVVQARRKKAPAANLWVSTLMAGSLFLYALVKVILEEISTSFG